MASPTLPDRDFRHHSAALTSRLKLLADVAGGLLTSDDPDAVLRAAMGASARDIGLDVCFSYVADAGQSTLHLTYGVGVDQKVLERIRSLPFGALVIGRAVRERRPIVIERVLERSDPSYAVIQEIGIRAYAVFPLIGPSGEVLGGLGFGSRSGDAFGEEDIGLFGTLAHYVAATRLRIRTDQALRDSERRYRLMADVIPHIVWTGTPDGRVDYVSSRHAEYTGIELGDGWDWAELLHPDDRLLTLAAWEQARRQAAIYEVEHRIRSRSGEYRWHLTRAVPMCDDSGQVMQWLGCATDTHDQHNQAEALRLARDAAERANASKTKFLAAASHDLRQPVQSALLLASTLHPSITDPGREGLIHLERSLEALKEQLDGLLDITQLDAGIVDPTLVDVPLDLILDEIRAAYAPVAQARGIGWDVQPTGADVRSDPRLLARMLRNLVENAFKYTERGRISVTCRIEDERLFVEVRDTGIGIPKQSLHAVFEEFHQLDNPERDRRRGLGLGLSIVRRLSELLDHPVDLRSAPGRGSVFSISVPLGERRDRVEPVTVGSARPSTDRLALIVEDDAVVLMGLQAVLRAWGYQVIAAGSTDEALERLSAAEQAPDILLVDYRLRAGRTGTEAILRVRYLVGRRVPAILLTGEVGSECQEDASRHGFEVLHKPITPRQLERLLLTLLEQEARLGAASR